VLGSADYFPTKARPVFGSKAGDCLHEMMFADSMSYLPDDILTKVDRAAMNVSLETRVPLLDHRLVEFAWTLPLEMKVSGNDSKRLLKQLADKHIPRSLLDRPKAGFGIPVSDWIRGPLRDWAENLLAPACLKEQGLLDPALVRKQWQQHLDQPSAGDERHWQVLAFQAWLTDANA